MVAKTSDLSLITLEEIAEEKGLKYAPDVHQGYSREYVNGSPVYRNIKGEIILNTVTLERIKSLKIPPAWTNVWITPIAKGHLQATGTDAKGRKQYIYHTEWTKLRCESKFDKMQQFGSVLPLIRKRIQKDISIKKINKQKILATVVGLLDHTLIRIGNKMYEKQNRSYGLTTLRNKHFKTEGKTVLLEFIGKKGVKQSIKITDSRLSGIVKKCKEIPGQRLFQFYDQDGIKHELDSHDVNMYLKEITGLDITAKDFRTWGASSHAIKLLQEIQAPSDEKELKKIIGEVVKAVAYKLGNTISVCRKHYLHPIVVEAYTDKIIHQYIEKNPKFHLRGSKALLPEEKIFLKIIQKIKD